MRKINKNQYSFAYSDAIYASIKSQRIHKASHQFQNVCLWKSASIMLVNPNKEASYALLDCTLS